ncbi:MAG: membrane dipeptidase [Protaetiibacter sp.]
MSITVSDLTITEDQYARARRIHDEAIVFDGSSVLKEEPAHFERAFAGGVTGTNHTVASPHEGYEEAVADMARCARWIADNSDKGILATTVSDIEEAKRSGREAIVFGPQNAEFLGTELGRLDVAYQLGMRIMQLTYQRQNYLGAGCGETSDAGLSRFGRRVVEEMDELGIVVDVSHCGRATALDAFAASKNPVVFTHAHSSAMSPHVRAKDDDVIRALADQGGVIGITALSAFNADPAEPTKRQGLTGFLRHVTHVAELVGIDHVGIGLDFDETNTPEKFAADHAKSPELVTVFGWDDKRIHGLADASEEFNVTLALVSAGFSDEEIVKVLGANFLRVFRQVWGS